MIKSKLKELIKRVISELNEEHGDVHYWGTQPKDKQYKISTGYTGTPTLPNSTVKK